MPPESVAVTVPSVPPLQVTFVPDVNAVGPDKFDRLLLLLTVQPFASVTVTV